MNITLNARLLTTGVAINFKDCFNIESIDFTIPPSAGYEIRV